MSDSFDVIVIGSGPGGYVCAIRCAQLGMKTALVEKYKTLGGTCLNVGCIPSKAWLDSSEKYHEAVNHFDMHGIEVGAINLDFSRMRKRVEDVVSQITKGVEFLMKKNKITVLTGTGSFKDANTVTVGGKDFVAKNIVIATGSKPASFPGMEIDKRRIISSTEALYLKDKVPPNSMTVIGGGVIGLEMGSVFQRLGTKVTVVEYADSILPTMDRELGKEMMKVLKKNGMTFHLATAVKNVENLGDKTKVVAETKDGKSLELESDYTLVSVGRRPFTEGLGLENIGIELDERKRVPVNENLQTKHSHIFAIGDVVRGAMLAHKAEEEGVYVAEFLAGEKPHINHNLIPGVVYTWPEVASVGKTEEQLKSDGVKYNKGKFPFKASGRAKASEESDGFIKVLSDATSDEVLGVHMIGPRTADMIAEAVLAMEFRASAEDIARVCHPHPTFTESLKEAALDATGKRALHI